MITVHKFLLVSAAQALARGCGCRCSCFTEGGNSGCPGSEMSLVPVDVGAAELVGATEFGLDGGPVLAELEKNRAAAGGVDEGAAGGGLEPGGTTGDG